MAFDVRVNGEHAKIVLSGDVDLQTTSDLKAEITKIVGVTHLEIDASSVAYIDSSGVAVLLLARQHCQQNNITLTLPLISIAVSRVLEIAKIDRILPIGQIVDSTSDTGMTGADESVATADDDLVSELLAADTAPSQPVASDFGASDFGASQPASQPASEPASEPAEESGAPMEPGDGGPFKPGSFS